MGLVLDVAWVLEAHGYGPFESGRQFVEVQQHLLHLLHGEPHRDCTGRVAVPPPESVASGAQPPQAEADPVDDSGEPGPAAALESLVVDHWEDLDRRIRALRESETATAAAMARFDEQQEQRRVNARRRRRPRARRRNR